MNIFHGLFQSHLGLLIKYELAIISLIIILSLHKRVDIEMKSGTALMFAHLCLASFLLNIGKQYSDRWDAAERGVPSRAILFVKRNFIKKLIKILKSLLIPLNMKWTLPNDTDGQVHLSKKG